MEFVLIILLAIGVFLAIVTVVGHGIWVLLARIFRSPEHSDSSLPRKPPELSRQERIDGATALGQLRRQLESFVFRNASDEEMRERLSAALLTEEQALADRRAVAALAVAVEEVELQPVVGAPVESALVGAADVVVGAMNSGPGTARLAEGGTPLHERARKYADSREAAAVAATVDEPVKPVKPAEPTVPASRLFAAFMEENNIRWGELVGGLLIVGCSVALVISLWSQIAGRPLLQFVLFNGVTASLFGVGMYTERRWKIHTTSRGLLVIATLLVPLNFLALAAFTQETPPSELLPIAGEVVSLVVFAMLVWVAGRIIAPGDELLLVFGVMAPCLMQLLVRRFAAPEMRMGVLYGLAAPPVIAYLGSAGMAIRKRWVAESGVLTQVEAHRIFLVLGVVSGAAIMPLALLLYFVPPVRTTLHWLSPLVSLCGLPALLVGLLFWRRLAETAFSGLQTAGIAVGALGAMVMCAGVVLAWPDPATLLPTAVVTAVAMLCVAVGFGIPAAHVPAAVAAAVAAMVGFYVLRGDVGWTAVGSAPLRSALLSATTGYVLLPVAAVFACVAWWLRSIRREEASFMYGLVTAATAAASLALAVWFGFGREGDPDNITWLLAIYALGALAAGVLLGRVDAARGGAAILFAAVVQCVVFRYRSAWGLEQPWITALLVHATLMAVVCGALAFVVTSKARVSSAIWAARFGDVLRALIWSALVTSGAAAIALAATMHSTNVGATAIHLAWLSAVWVMLAVLNAAPAIFTASQIAAVLAILFGVAAGVASREWYAATRHPWLDPWFSELVGIAIAAYCLLIGGLRWYVARAQAAREVDVLESAAPTWMDAAKRLVNTAWPAVDHVAEVALVVLVIFVATYAVAPGVAQELSPREVAGERLVPLAASFEVPGIPHSHAAGPLAWLLIGAVAIALSLRFWDRGVCWRAAGLVIVAMAICPLVASRWEPDIAVASALRWASACFFVVASIALWAKRRKVADASTVSEDALPATATARIGALPLERVVRDMLVAFVALVYVAMGAFVVQAALGRADVSMGVQGVWPWVLLWSLLAGVVALFLPYVGAENGRARMARLYRPAVSAGNYASWTVHARDVLLLLAAAPVVILVTFAVAKVFDAHPIIGPEPGSWFVKIGLDVSYGVPLALVALAFIGHAIRDRSSRFAFAAGLLFNAVATLALLWRTARGGGVLDTISWIRVAQVNAIVAGVVALVWEGAVWLYEGRLAESLRDSNSRLRHGESSIGETQPRGPLLLVTQVGLAAALCGTFLLPGVVNLLFDEPPAAWAVAADGMWGWSAFVLAAVAGASLWWRRSVSQTGVGLFAAALVAIIALTAARTDNGDWPAYHTLLAGNCIAMWALPLLTIGAQRLIVGRREDAVMPGMIWSSRAVWFFGIVSVFLAFWGYESDPQSPWWTVAVLFAVSVYCIWTAWLEGRRGSVWLAALLVVPATSILWLDWGKQFSGTGGFGQACEFLWVNVLAVALVALISVWIERRRGVLRTAETQRSRGIGFHRFAAWAVVVTLLLTTFVGLGADFEGSPMRVSALLAWAAWLAGAVVAVACLWDPAVRWPVACLYCLGLTAVGMYLDGLDFRTPMFQWALANALAAYSLGTSGMWAGRAWLGKVVGRWGARVEDVTEVDFNTGLEPASRRDAATWGGGGHGWLVPANVLLGAFVLVLVVFVELSVSDFTQRMVAAYAVGAQAFAIGLLARGGVRTPLQYLALVWGALFAVAFGWAFLPPDFVEPWLHRLVVTVAALAAVVVLYGFGLVKLLRRENEWTRAASRLMPPLAVITVALVLVVLGAEVRAFVQDGSVQITAAARVVIGVALFGLVLASLAAALLPGRDPLGLSERGRTLYVYAAEALAALLFLHIRVTMPWLFRGWFMQFWPLVVMAIAFVGVGLGEVFQRRRQQVLSEPLQTTGVLLPLLPVLGFWFVDSQVHYSLLLLSIGVLYASLSVLRRSFLYGVLAAIAANGSLWFLLHDRQGLSFLDHPQLWLIPPALSALIAGYINRERLTAQQSAALRYASAIVIYVSSTADIFINGVANAPWLPAVLAGLSIVGVLAGIWLRVRAFLYLGTAFLIVAIMTIIWHAAFHQERTYILWVAGILTGALIIALFGLFEKRRDDVLRVVEELKHWHA